MRAVTRGLRLRADARAFAVGSARRLERLSGEPGRAGRLPPPPRFLVIGAQKGGTRWLRLNLGKHPDVFAPWGEPNHFNRAGSFRQGLDAYRARFTGWRGEPIVGEATPQYMVWGSTLERRSGPGVPPGGRPARIAARIEQQLPDVRLFAVLRDPSERAFSAFLHHIQHGRIDPNADFLEYLDAHPPGSDRYSLISAGWYAASLAPYFERFGDRLLVFLNEDFAREPAAVYRRALEHIGADPRFVPEDLEKRIYSARLPESSRHRQPDGRARKLSAEERAAVLEHFTEDLAELETMLGRDLSSWRSPRV